MPLTGTDYHRWGFAIEDGRWLGFGKKEREMNETGNIFIQKNSAVGAAALFFCTWRAFYSERVL